MEKRNNVLRRLTGRAWGQKASALRSLYIGYTQSAAEYNLCAWGPLAPPSTLDIIQRKQNAAARIITGGTRDSPILPLLTEAGLIPVEKKVKYHATLHHERVMRLSTDNPARATASDNSIKVRYQRKGKKITPPRETANEVLLAMGLGTCVREEKPHHPSVPPWKWERAADIRIHLEL